MANNAIVNGISVDLAADNGKVPVLNTTTKAFDMTTPSGGGVTGPATTDTDAITYWADTTGDSIKDTSQNANRKTYFDGNQFFTIDSGTSGVFTISYSPNYGIFPYDTNSATNPNSLWSSSTILGGVGAGTGSDQVLIGYSFNQINSTSSSTNGVYIGSGSGHTAGSLTIDSSIAIGYQARVSGDNQLVFGGNASRVYDVYYGPITGTAAAAATTIQPGGGSGTNKQGVNLQIAAGKGTGNSTTDGDIVFLTPDAGSTGTTLQTLTEKFRIDRSGSLVAPTTITTPGTTGNQTINKPTGRVNIAAAGTTVTVTNNLVTANSTVIAVAATNDTTARVTNVVPGAGSFVINTVAVTAETAFSFIVIS